MGTRAGRGPGGQCGLAYGFAVATSRAAGNRLMSRSTTLLIAAFVAVSAGFLLFPSARPRTGAPNGQRLPASEEARVATGAGAAATPAPPRGRDAAEGRAAIRRSEEHAEAARARAAELRQKARFPPTSRRIEDNVDPIIEMRAVKERLSPPAEGRKPTLVVFSSSLSYEAPNPIILFAKFLRAYPGDQSLRTDAEIVGELRNAAGEVVAEVDLRDDGRERDIEAGDGVFTARLTPDADDGRRWNGLIAVRVYGETADGERRSAKTRFYYGEPAAKLTGNYRDELVDGHLRILAEIAVKEPGEYRLDATLGGAQGLLAWAENTAALEPGTRWMPLLFWGLSLREANEPGPYRLSSIALANVSVHPPQLNDAIGSTYRTAPYRPQDFSDERYGDPRLLEKADRYDDEARGETTRAR